MIISGHKNGDKNAGTTSGVVMVECFYTDLHARSQNKYEKIELKSKAFHTCTVFVIFTFLSCNDWHVTVVSDLPRKKIEDGFKIKKKLVYYVIM